MPPKLVSRSMASRRGRPRDNGADERILAATLEALASVGYQALNVDEVAAVAGVAKTTLYRRWPTKEELVLSCLQERSTRRSPAETGDWREDIRRWVEAMIDDVNTPEGKAYNSVITAAHNNPDLRLPITRHDAPVRLLRHALEEGVRSGELRPDLDVDLTMDLLASVVPFRTLLLREDVAPELADGIVSLVLDGACVRSTRQD